MYTVYILECLDGSLYCGITNDLKRRLGQHKAGKASAYTTSRGVRGVVYTEKRRTKGAALKREAQIKRLTRADKLGLIFPANSASFSV